MFTTCLPQGCESLNLFSWLWVVCLPPVCRGVAFSLPLYLCFGLYVYLFAAGLRIFGLYVYHLLLPQGYEYLNLYLLLWVVWLPPVVAAGLRISELIFVALGCTLYSMFGTGLRISLPLYLLLQVVQYVYHLFAAGLQISFPLYLLR
jgi:hypothetical protein